jgi:pimeloyl-ACP methyl ester carboxylesterase
MSLVSRAFYAAVVVVILAPISMADDPSGVSANPELATIIPRLEVRLGQVPPVLKMRRPYEQGKIPVVLIHGLCGFPRQWDRMVEYLEAEPDLRERYQFWSFGYESGNSIPFSAHLLRQSLRQARLLFDPKGTDLAFDRMVLVGHSLGGILAKMMGQDSGLRLWQTVCDLPIDKIAGPQKDCLLLRQVYCYERVPEVRRIVFIATPHRGSPLASGLVRDLGSRLFDRASSFREARATIRARNDAGSFVSAFHSENPTSVGELAEGHPLLAALCDLGIDPSVRSHSIIADLRDPPRAGATDGIVPYSSSRLEGAGSELILHGSHICLSNFAMFQEVRRVLREHARIDLPSRTGRGGLARIGLERAPKQ